MQERLSVVLPTYNERDNIQPLLRKLVSITKEYELEILTVVKPQNENTEKKYWKDARRHILHGNMLLSKHPKIHLPGSWPTYFKKAKDCWVWDLGFGKIYIFLE